MHTLILILYPLNFFFFFLFYTDAFSLTFILLAFLLNQKKIAYFEAYQIALSKKKHENYAFSLGQNAYSFMLDLLLFSACSFAILMRQTNVVWVCYLAGSYLVHRLSSTPSSSFKSASSTSLMNRCTSKNSSTT